MDSLSPQVVSAAKLPILNPSEFDLWKMRIDQYFLMTDYSLWEVILNGDSPVPTRVVDGVLQPVSPTTAKQSTTESVSVAASVSAVNAKLHVSSLPNVDSLSNAMIYSFFASQSSSPQLDNDDLKHIDADDLKEMDLKWQMAMKGHFGRECRSLKDLRRNGSYDWSFQAEEEPANYALMAFSYSSSSSNNEVVSCSTASLESVEARLLVYKQNEYVFEEDIKLLKLKVQLRDNALVNLKQTLEKAEQERDDLKLKLEKFQTSSKNVTELLASQTNAKTESDESWPPSSLYDRFQSSDGYHAVPLPYTGLFMPPKPDLVFNNAPTAVETDHPAFTTPQNVPSFVQPSEQVKYPRHSVQHAETSIPPQIASPKPTCNGKRRNRKACFVCKSLDHLIKDCDYHEKKMAQPTARNHAHRGTHKHYDQMTHQIPYKHMVPAAVFTQPKLVSITVVRPVSTAVPKIKAPVVNAAQGMQGKWGNPQHVLKDKGVIDSGFSRHMIGNMSYLSDFVELNGGYVAFGSNSKGGKISGKGKIKTGKLDFDDVYFLKELKFNLFSVSQMFDKKNSVLFTDTECLVLSPNFKLSDESQVLLRVPRENNMYNVNLKNIVPFGDLTCLFAKATIDESNLWHKRLGHINFKTMNKLVKGNLVRGLPTKVFENDNTCAACKKGKQHRASCKTNLPVLNNDLNQFCGMKGIKREFSIPRTPQQNGIAERKNRTLIEAARTMLADSLLPILFGAEAVNTACYVQNRVLVTKPHNKTPYALLHGRTPSIGFMRPFSCPVTILNTLDSLGKFERKVDEGVLVGYSVSSKAFRVFNSRIRIVQETLHVNFLENKPNVAGNQSNLSVGFQDKFDAEKEGEESDQQYVLFPVWFSGFTNPQNTDGDAAFDRKEPEFDEKKLGSKVNVSLSSSAQSKKQDDKTKREAKGKSPVVSFTRYRNLSAKFEDLFDNNINEVNATSTLVPTIGQISPNSTNTFSDAGPSNAAASPTHRKSSCIDASLLPDDPDMPELEDITYSDDEDDVGAEADFKNLETSITISPIPTTRVLKDHHVIQIISDLSSATQTKSMTKVAKDQELLVPNGFSRIKKMKEALRLGTKQDLSHEDTHKRRELTIKKCLLRIEAIRLFLAYASFMGFMVYQMDVKSAFLYGTTEEEVYVCQPLGFEDPNHPDKVYKVVNALYGLHQALRAWQKGDILLVQIYVDDIIFGLTNKDLCKAFERQVSDEFNGGTHILFGSLNVKSTSTPIDTEKPLLKDLDGEDVDVNTYRSMIGSLMYLTSSRPDIMFAVCACARFQVTQKASHLHAVKRIFRYLKGKPHLGLWYPKDSPFDLVDYSDSDYAGASLDRKSTTGGCQFLRCKLIFWQCKKQTVVATSSIEAKYVAAASCRAQVLWIQNQLLDYGNAGYSKWYEVFEKDVTCYNYLKCWFTYHTTNGSQFTRSNPHQELASPDQTVSGKDSSNPLMADNLPKIVWYLTHHVTLMKSWLVQKQTALGKDKANPLIVDSLLKTIWSSIPHLLINEVLTIPGQTATGVNTPRCDKDMLELMKLTVFLLPKVEKVRIRVGAVDLQVPPFWTTVAVKKVNDVIRLQALVDKKKVVVTEATIPEVLRLDDAEGVECLPNEEIFVELARMGYKKPSTKLIFYKAFFSSQWKFLIHTILQCMSAKRTSWNEFSSSMASAIICLSSGRNFNFSKYIFDSLVRNVDSPSKFYMYPRFLQLIIKKQVVDVLTHTTKYTSLALTQKVFANMKRVGKGFFGVDTPFFEGMLVAQEVEEGDENVENVNAGDAVEGDVSAAHNVEVPTADEEPFIPSPTPPTPPPQPSHDIPSTSQAQPTPPQSPQVQPQSPQPQPQPQPQQDAGIPINLLQEVLDTCTALSRRVEHLEFNKIAQALEIKKLKRRVKKLERRNKVKVLKLRRLQKVRTTQRVETSDETMMDDVSNQRRMIAEMDQDADVVLEEAKEVADDAKADQDAKGDESVDVQGMKAESQAEIYKIDLEHANKVLSMQEDESKPAEVQEVVDVVTTTKIITEVVTAASETITAASTNITAAEAQVPATTLTAAPARVTAAPSRRRKRVVIRDPEESTTPSTINPAETKSKDKGKGILVEEPKPLKKQAQIEQDEQYTRELEAELNRTIDWDEVIDHVKMKAKGDPAVKREDLEALWSLVKERFTSAKPKNFSDDFLLITLEAMFEKPDIHAQIWKNQRSIHGPAKVKGWKLLELCGVQIITFTTTQLILLVERKYPLTRFTLDQMLNAVRLEVEEESEVSLELLSFGVDAAKEFKKNMLSV
nr:hypothetical protein [Tanacetum cinerariifolium]